MANTVRVYDNKLHEWVVKQQVTVDTNPDRYFTSGPPYKQGAAAPVKWPIQPAWNPPAVEEHTINAGVGATTSGSNRTASGSSVKTNTVTASSVLQAAQRAVKGAPAAVKGAVSKGIDVVDDNTDWNGGTPSSGNPDPTPSPKPPKAVVATVKKVVKKTVPAGNPSGDDDSAIPIPTVDGPSIRRGTGFAQPSADDDRDPSGTSISVQNVLDKSVETSKTYLTPASPGPSRPVDMTAWHDDIMNLGAPATPPSIAPAPVSPIEVPKFTTGYTKQLASSLTGSQNTKENMEFLKSLEAERNLPGGNAAPSSFGTSTASAMPAVAPTTVSSTFGKVDPNTGSISLM